MLRPSLRMVIATGLLLTAASFSTSAHAQCCGGTIGSGGETNPPPCSGTDPRELTWHTYEWPVSASLSCDNGGWRSQITGCGGQSACNEIGEWSATTCTCVELFGSVSEQPASARRNGFESLRLLDSNGDSMFDDADNRYLEVAVWIDRNQNGRNEDGELLSLGSLGIKGISLNYRESRRSDQYGNLFRYHSTVLRQRGSKVASRAWDVFLLSPAPYCSGQSGRVPAVTSSSETRRLQGRSQAH